MTPRNAMPTSVRLPYEDADSTQDMAANASACSAEKHLARATAALATARRTVEAAPTALLQSPQVVKQSTVTVTDAAARFAAKLFD